MCYYQNEMYKFITDYQLYKAYFLIIQNLILNMIKLFLIFPLKFCKISLSRFELYTDDYIFI